MERIDILALNQSFHEHGMFLYLLRSPLVFSAIFMVFSVEILHLCFNFILTISFVNTLVVAFRIFKISNYLLEHKDFCWFMEIWLTFHIYLIYYDCFICIF